jgi:polar amino acid transport system substrate-binding protein
MMYDRRTGKAFFLLLILSPLFVLLFSCSARQDDSFARIKKAGSISFAMSCGYPPFSFYNDTNQVVGFDVDVSKEVAKRLGVQAKIIITDWSDIINGLRSESYDAILGSMSVTEERAAAVGFSIPYYYSRSRVLVRKGSLFKDPGKDLRGKGFGVAKGTPFENDAKMLGAGNIRLYEDDEQALIALQKGAVDAAISDEIVGIYLAKRKNLTIELIGDPLRTEKIAVAFRKGDESLLLHVNKILKAMQDDGTLRLLSEKIIKNEYK